MASNCGSTIECLFQSNPISSRLIATLVVFVIAFAIVKLGDRALTRSATRLARMRRLDEHQTRVLVGRTKPMRLSIRLVMLVVTGLAILAIYGLQTAFTGLLAGAGFAGIVIGLAAADTIGDVIAGFLIFYNHPFDLGDWVEIDGVQGLVDDVALGATTIITFDNEKVTIPNRLVEGQKIVNFSHARRLRRKMVVGVEYGSDLEKATRLLLDIAHEHPDIYRDPEPSVISRGFGASSVDLELRFWVEPVRSSAIKIYTELIHTTHDRFRAEGLVIAFPHMQIVQSKPWQIGDAFERSSPEAS